MMTKKLFSLLILFSVIHNSYAMQCPNAVTGITFKHQIAPNVENIPWSMDITYLSKGWYIDTNPLSDGSQQTTVLASAPVTVVYVQAAGNTGLYYVTCEYQIEGAPMPVNLLVSNSQAYPAPFNNNFKRIAGNKFVCQTDASHTNICGDSGGRSPVFGQ
jgi:hypothetical protein